MSELPRLYVMFRDDHPEIAEAFDTLGSAAHEEGPLDERSRALVKLSLAVGAGLEGAVHAHVRKCLDRGISREEIVHAIILALPTLGWPRMHSAWTWARDIFQERWQGGTP